MGEKKKSKRQIKSPVRQLLHPFDTFSHPRLAAPAAQHVLIQTPLRSPPCRLTAPTTPLAWEMQIWHHTNFAMSPALISQPQLLVFP